MEKKKETERSPISSPARPTISLKTKHNKNNVSPPRPPRPQIRAHALVRATHSPAHLKLASDDDVEYTPTAIHVSRVLPKSKPKFTPSKPGPVRSDAPCGRASERSQRHAAAATPTLRAWPARGCGVVGSHFEDASVFVPFPPLRFLALLSCDAVYTHRLHSGPSLFSRLLYTHINTRASARARCPHSHSPQPIP